MLTFPFYRPGRKAKHVKMPLLVTVCDEDTITPAAPAAKAAERAPRGGTAPVSVPSFRDLSGPTSQGRSGGVPSANGAGSVRVIKWRAGQAANRWPFFGVWLRSGVAAQGRQR